jgi:hypothetical protein
VSNQHPGETLPIELRIAGRRHARERSQIVQPKRHDETVLVRELARKPPADTHVTEVVDDPAKEIPAGDGRRHGRATTKVG